VWGGTVKLLTLFRRATGEVQAKGVTSAPNTVLHRWRCYELTRILQVLLQTAPCGEDASFLPYWWLWWQGLADRYNDPPVRLVLIWDNLAGHKTPELVHWLCHQGSLPLYTPLSGA
jgi:hypothetical protein